MNQTITVFSPEEAARMALQLREQCIKVTLAKLGWSQWWIYRSPLWLRKLRLRSITTVENQDTGQFYVARPNDLSTPLGPVIQIRLVCMPMPEVARA